MSTLRPPYPIVTRHLQLRPVTPDDLDAIHAYRSRADVCRYLYDEPMSRDAVRDWISKRVDRTCIRGDGDILGLGLVVSESQELIGDVMLHLISTTHAQGEIGYTINPDHGGHGYATEASVALLRLGFETQDGLGLHRIIGRLDARNTASARLLERLGMRREAHLIQNEFVKGEWCDEAIYALLADEWLAQVATARAAP